MRDWTLVFDLDGTLVDTAPDLAAATNHVMRHLRLEAVNEKDIRPFVGHGALVMIDKAAAAHGRVLKQHELYGLFEVFIQHYTANIAVNSKPYDGVLAALKGLADDGARLAVCTNKIEAHATALLDALGMSPLFSAVTGRDTFAVFKPDPGHLTGTIERAGGIAAKSVMIGDSETDIRTAKAAGIPVIAVDFGYSIEPVAMFEPSAIISHYDELRASLATLTRPRA
jgi:phosphoglycolate phosphatase